MGRLAILKVKLMFLTISTSRLMILRSICDNSHNNVAKLDSRGQEVIMGECIKTGWEQENRVHFDEIVVNYDKVRWNYPQQIFEDIFEYSGLGKGKKALEIGAGTGKATTPVLDAGYDVTAVELGVNMAKYISVKHKGYKNFNVIVDAFEDVILTEGIYDLVYAASAFHWVDAEIGCPKVFRLLKPGGTFALLRNNNYTADGDALYEEIQAVYEKYYFSYYTSNERLVRHSNKDLMEPNGIKQGFGFEDLSVYGFNDIILKFYDKTLTYTADDYIAFIDTMSPNRKLPEENRVALYSEIKQAILKYGGQYSQDTVFTLYMGRS